MCSAGLRVMARLLLTCALVAAVGGVVGLGFWLAVRDAECSSALASDPTPFWATLVPSPDPTAVAYWKDNREDFIGPPAGWKVLRETEGSPPAGYATWDDFFSYLRSLRDYPDVAPDSVILAGGSVGGEAQVPRTTSSTLPERC
jgi:hypothetical protein